MWIWLDDRFPEHRKVVGLSDAAFRTEVAAICYSSRNLTDGWVPRASEADELVTARLWLPADDGSGFLLHDYLAYQRSRADVMAQRKKRSEAGRTAARARWTTGQQDMR